MTSDPLSDVLDLLHARCILSGTLVAGGAWTRKFSQPDAIKFCAVTRGGCWLKMEGGEPPCRFEAGDVIVVNGKRPMILASRPELLGGAVRAPQFHDVDGNARLGTGDDFTMIGGQVMVDPIRQGLLVDGLPPLIHIQVGGAGTAAIRWPLEQLVAELRDRPFGATVVIADLAKLLFVQALRIYLKTPDQPTAGWLGALGDDRIGKALRLMHGDASRAWTLEALATAAGMSRTTFAVHFKVLVGIPPMTYLLNWRMHLAERDLRERGSRISEVANTYGYATDSAFSNAFKRVMGVAPSRSRLGLTDRA